MTHAPKFLGEDRFGNRYFLHDDNYVYQQNIYGRENGWFCSGSAWERTMHRICQECAIVNTANVHERTK